MNKWPMQHRLPEKQSNQHIFAKLWWYHKFLIPKEIGPVVLEKKILKFLQCNFFLIISPWKSIWPFIWTNLNPLHNQGCFEPSFVEIGPMVLEKKIFKFRQGIFPILLLSLLGKGCGPSFEQTWIPSLPQVSLKLAHKFVTTDRTTDSNMSTL